MSKMSFEIRKHNVQVGMNYPPECWDKFMIKDPPLDEEGGGDG